MTSGWSRGGGSWLLARAGALGLVLFLLARVASARERDLSLEPPDWSIVGYFLTWAGTPGTALPFDADAVADLATGDGVWRASLLRPGSTIAPQRTPLFSCGITGGISRRADLNGDGQDDLVQAYPYATNRRGFNFVGGRVAVFWTPHPAPDLPELFRDDPRGDWTLVGGFETTQLSRRLAVGDFDGDGAADLVAGGIGQLEIELGLTTDTCIYGIRGPLPDDGVLDLLTDSTDFKLCGACRFGDTMALGDLDGDGVAELIVSCDDALRLFRGQRLAGDVDWNSPDALIVLPTASRGQAAADNLPLVTRDVNGDRRDDLLIGLPLGDGEVDLVLGRAPLPAVIDLNVTPPDLAVHGAPGSELGSTIAVGNFTSGGSIDLVAGAPRSDGLGGLKTDAGAIEVLSGLDTLRGVVDVGLTLPTERLHGVDAGDGLGSGRNGSGLVVADMSGDGIDDIAADAPGGRGPANASPFAAGEMEVIYGAPRGPYDLWHSLGDPASLSLLAPGVASPWDGPAGLLDDGALRFFRIEESAGEEVTILVTKQESDRTVRVSWRDASPGAVAPDPVLSSVMADVTCVLPDGQAVAEIIVLPRDARGERLGSGLEIRPSAPASWLPGVPVGGFADRGDGTYSIQVAAANPGSAVISVEVEGVILVDAPVIDFAANAPDVTAQATPATGSPGVEVTLSVTVTGGASPFQYEWDINGDGLADSTEQSPRHVYSAGAWRAVATVTDAGGCVGRGSVAVTVRP